MDANDGCAVVTPPANTKRDENNETKEEEDFDEEDEEDIDEEEDK